MRTLILVDLQNDFMPGGALGIAGGDEVVSVANRLQGDYELVLATQDWHPPDHGSFAANHEGKSPGDRIDLAGLEQILWPAHCVQRSTGAAFHREFDLSHLERVFRKGADVTVDSYSAFFDNAQRSSTGLDVFLREREVKQIEIMGLATDYCVRFSALDGVRLGLEVSVLLEGCRGVELQPGDVDRAVEEMRAAGVRIVGQQ
jgi:nicotinamidase/pyrazinamidase